ncbi:hypothetical protein ATO6_19800 [Oceanicola sp. 22II-s10i]|uniref:phosphotriesterase family protein n=1 Tax=Oceanicola sp. 22II-s10i TaxID=1317116 RepID=UPI000B528791|nr:phosphotriesterase-related protein [Oceanicola sp. 22II-s10i]OWU83109.1 hypothetical protein ATO6_19800 [Oceanicola sp. 22II-s10i]
MTIQTVTGAIAAEDLGKTLMHEHVFIAMPGSEFDPWYPVDRSHVIDLSVRKLKALRAHGVRTFVDPAPIELGRDPVLLREIAEAAEMTIICTTGFYHEAVGLPAYWRAQPAESIAELYIREIEEGIGDSGIRAGAIKCGTGEPAISALEEKFMEAAAIAQKATGVPVFTHTQAGCCGPEQAAFFRAQGVPMDKVVIGHSCGNASPDYHARILAEGACIGFDRVSYEFLMPDATRAENAKRIIDDGHIDRLILSQDIPLYWTGRYPFAARDSDAVRTHRAIVDAGDTWPVAPTFLFDDFLPRLRALGVTEAQIDHVLVENPKRFFG